MSRVQHQKKKCKNERPKEKGGESEQQSKKRGGGLKFPNKSAFKRIVGGKQRQEKNSHTIAEGKVFNQPIQTIKARCNCLGSVVGGSNPAGMLSLRIPAQLLIHPKLVLLAAASRASEPAVVNYAVLSDTFPTSSPGNDKSPSVWRLAFGFVVELS